MSTVWATGANSLARLREAYSAPNSESRTQLCVSHDTDTHEHDVREEGEDANSESALESEWDAVAARTHILHLEHKANHGKVVPSEDVSSAVITWKEAQSWALQLGVVEKVLQPLENQAADSRSSNVLRRRTKLGLLATDKQVQRSTEVVLHLRATPFDFNVPTHFRMLRTIYTKLTLNKWCPSVGGHWELLGFQGGDPRTDLNRSGGVLNVLHFFSLVVNHRDLAVACFQLSQDERQSFPLACISINITSLVMEKLLAGGLSAVSSKASNDSDMLELSCRLHNAGLVHFCSRWRSQKRTIQHTEQTRNEVKALLDRKPAKLLEELTQGLSCVRSKKSSTGLPEQEFADLEVITDVPQAPPSQRRSLWARSKAAVLRKRLRRYQDENCHA